MPAYQIHIKGLVQGVGFRPFVHKLAIEMGMKGWVNNGTDGVRIFVSALQNEIIVSFYHTIIQNPPKNAIITFHSMKEIEAILVEDFSIQESAENTETALLIAPDIAICEECKTELYSPENQRFQYPFITCVNCGPRYSIQTATPYDRATTTMKALEMCDFCDDEYRNISNKRHHSQTNSCPNCAISLHLFTNESQEIELSQTEIIDHVADYLKSGKIVALKATGGYLLLCDATNQTVIDELRTRKQRPKKPFALLFRSMDAIRQEVRVRPCESQELQSAAAPIVLCKILENKVSKLKINSIAPNLSKLGVMLPNSPLLQLVVDKFQQPLIATSANLSGSPIIYKDIIAKEQLSGIADFIVSYDREIVAPQDDSVVQFTETQQRIVLRRSRGLAPNYFPIPIKLPNEQCLAIGAELKSAFAISTKEQLFVSQFLGDQASIESQESFEVALSHISNLMRFSPEVILADKHPAYFSTQKANEIARIKGAKIEFVQHHKAHFMAVLAENNLLNSAETILGVIWDGAGYGNDGQIWGGEFFSFTNNKCQRVAHFDYFPQLLGDKMSKEPRLSALSLLVHSECTTDFVENHFSNTEWRYYQQLMKQPIALQTSSIGRFLDGISCLLGLISKNSFEGEGAMLLEVLALTGPNNVNESYPFEISNFTIQWKKVIEGILTDLEQHLPKEIIAVKVFSTLVNCIEKIATKLIINKIAFSGGVFQNSFLVDKIQEKLGRTHTLYFHQQLSPNDESIGFGQVAWYVNNITEMKNNSINFELQKRKEISI